MSEMITESSSDVPDRRKDEYQAEPHGVPNTASAPDIPPIFLEPTTPEHAVTLPLHAPRRAWHVWLQWFSAQIIVVVTGVLVALALNAWWAARQSAARAQTYLRQLDADLAETDRIVDSYDRFLQPVDSTGALVVRAFRSPTLPSADTLSNWLLVSSRFGTPRPVVGTAEALVTTGDLALIRNDSLRVQIVAYLEYNRALLATQDAVSEIWRRGFTLVNARIDFSDLVLGVRSPGQLDSLARSDPFFEFPAGSRRRPFPLDTTALFGDRQTYEGLWTMNSAKRNLAGIRADMRAEARRLRTGVRAALEE